MNQVYVIFLTVFNAFLVVFFRGGASSNEQYFLSFHRFKSGEKTKAFFFSTSRKYTFGFAKYDYLGKPEKTYLKRLIICRPIWYTPCIICYNISKPITPTPFFCYQCCLRRSIPLGKEAYRTPPCTYSSRRPR